MATDTEAESSHLQRQAQRREGELELEGSFKLSMPTRLMEALVYGYKHTYLERNKQHVHLVT